MNLQQKLDAQKKKTETSAPKEALEIMHRATEDLARSGIMEHIVKKGDSLSTIAEQFNVTLPALMAWNDLSSENFIRPGEKLVIYQ